MEQWPGIPEGDCLREKERSGSEERQEVPCSKDDTYERRREQVRRAQR